MLRTPSIPIKIRFTVLLEVGWTCELRRGERGERCPLLSEETDIDLVDLVGELV